MYINSVHNPELRKYEKFSTVNSVGLFWRKIQNTFFAKFKRFYDHLLMYFWPTDALDENDGEYCPSGMICQNILPL